MMALNVIRLNLKWMRDRTGNQLRNLGYLQFMELLTIECFVHVVIITIYYRVDMGTKMYRFEAVMKVADYQL